MPAGRAGINGRLFCYCDCAPRGVSGARGWKLPLRRYHLFEILDQPWCPRPVRDGATAFLEYITSRTDLYSAVREQVLEAIRTTGSHQVVDLCSGGGGPWLGGPWRAACDDPRWPLSVVLTDKFPSLALEERLKNAGNTLRQIAAPVDARHIDPALQGFRTIFASFHHFRDEEAREVLRDAVRSGTGIASAEVTSRRARALAAMCLLPFAVLLLTPRMRPARLSHLVLTYLLPLIPLTIGWDGVVSCLRTRTPEELLALTKDLPEFTWVSGYCPAPGTRLPVVFLIGVPAGTSALP